MHSEDDQRVLDDPAAGRRDFLRLLATGPFAVQAGLWLIACGGEEQPQEDPYAGREDVDTAGDAGAGSPSGSGETDAGSDTGGSDAGDASGASGNDDTAASGSDDTAASGGDDGELVTEIAAMQPTVDALKYTHASTTEGQRCDNCQFYTAKGDGLGKCQLFTQGLVTSGGWCSSWTKKIQTG